MRFNQFLILSTLILFLFSCSRDNSTIFIFDDNEFLGSDNTERTYIETEKWLQVSTNEPFIEIPQDLNQKVSLSDQQINSGICKIINYKEVVSPIEESYYTSWKLPLSKDNYIQVLSVGTLYSLEREILSIQSGENYLDAGYQYGPDIFQKSSEGILTVTLPSLQEEFPQVVYYKNTLHKNDSWIRYKYINISKDSSIIETVATVIDEENIDVPAGSFIAFKIKLTTYHYNPNYSFEDGYEYYVPNVGLALKESDQVVSQWNSGTNETRTFRQIIRKELVDYNFIKE